MCSCGSRRGSRVEPRRLSMSVFQRILCGIIGALAVTMPNAPAQEARKTLDIYFIDVGESVGNATLVVAPSGETMLLDAGPPRMVDRVLDAIKQAGVKRVDYLVTTHYHADHFGGTAELARKIDIVHFVDHGPSVETGKDDEWWKQRRGPWFRPDMGKAYDELFKSYAKARDQGRQSVVRPGDWLPIMGVEVRVVCAAGKVLAKRRPGAGQPSPPGADVAPRAEDDGEDAQSIGVVVSLGSFRFCYLGDLTW